MSLLLAACTGGESLPDRRTVDKPTSLIYPDPQFAGVADFADVKVRVPAGYFRVPGFRPGVAQVWSGPAQVREAIGVNHDANDAVKRFTENDPRKSALELLGPDSLVGKTVPYAAPGDPESSQIYCDTLHASDPDRCDAWTWWARYGQYTVELDVGQGPSVFTVDRAEFEKLIDLVAAHLAATVGPRTRPD